MTVTYSNEVATGRVFLGGFSRLLFRWKGSVYKLIWADLSFWLVCYFTISITYRTLLSESQKKSFKSFCSYCDNAANELSIGRTVSFILGFYITLIVNRWWTMWDTLPWPDTIAFFLSASLHGHDDRAKLLRRSIMRYVNLAMVHCMTLFSTRVQKRFPTFDHLVAAGLMEETEKRIFQNMSASVQKLYWLPLAWASAIASHARREGFIRDDVTLNTLLQHISDFRNLCGRCLHVDIINVPLVYTQVVTLAVYTHFVACLFTRQYLTRVPEEDYYFPFFTVVEFIFYMGWLKVAEILINPFGEDDEDFELNWLIDRHIKVTYMIVDEMHEEHPELMKDAYWDEGFPEDGLPYTEETKGDKGKVFFNSAEPHFRLDNLFEEFEGLERHNSVPLKRKVGISMDQMEPMRSRSLISKTASVRRFLQGASKTRSSMSISTRSTTGLSKENVLCRESKIGPLDEEDAVFAEETTDVERKTSSGNNDNEQQTSLSTISE